MAISIINIEFACEYCAMFDFDFWQLLLTHSHQVSLQHAERLRALAEVRRLQQELAAIRQELDESRKQAGVQQHAQSRRSIGTSGSGAGISGVASVSGSAPGGGGSLMVSRWDVPFYMRAALCLGLKS